MGNIKNPKRSKQLFRFEGFGFDNKELKSVGATDIDAIVDVRDKILIVFEVKFDGKQVPKGQRYALQRLVGDAKANGKHAIAIVVDHYVYEYDEDVYLANLIVREVFESESMTWKPMKKRITARELANWYVGRYFK